MDKIKIVVSGRIPKYLFGTLQDSYREELSKAVDLCNDEIECEQDFLNLILQLTLELAETRRVEFFEIISKEDLETLPNFNQLVNDIIEQDWNHFDLIHSDFLKVPNWNGGYLTMFEGDSYISVFKNDEKIIDEVKLENFVETVDSWYSDDDEENQDLESFNSVKELIHKNPDHFDSSDYFSWGKNEEGCIFLEGYFNPPAFTKFIEESRIDDEYCSGGQLSIHFDDYSDWRFFIDTEDFQMSDLTFVNWSSCEQFRYSAYPCKFVQLYHRGELCEPDEIWYRDKGISLSYEEDTLDTLVNI
jgi:hypothetical protein